MENSSFLDCLQDAFGVPLAVFLRPTGHVDFTADIDTGNAKDVTETVQVTLHRVRFLQEKGDAQRGEMLANLTSVDQQLQDNLKEAEPSFKNFSVEEVSFSSSFFFFFFSFFLSPDFTFLVVEVDGEAGLLGLQLS